MSVSALLPLGRQRKRGSGGIWEPEAAGLKSPLTVDGCLHCRLGLPSPDLGGSLSAVQPVWDVLTMGFCLAGGLLRHCFRHLGIVGLSTFFEKQRCLILKLRMSSFVFFYEESLW